MTLSQTEFLFLRHGETDWNTKGLSQGRVDIPLNAVGKAQAADAAHALQGLGIARIISSTLSRAVETAQIVAAALGMSATSDPDLREASFGDQEGQVMGAWYNDWVAGTYTPVGGESFADLRARVIPAINRAVHPPGLALIVAHGAMFRAARAAMGLSPRVRTDNGVALRCVPGTPWTLIPLAGR